MHGLSMSLHTVVSGNEIWPALLQGHCQSSDTCAVAEGWFLTPPKCLSMKAAGGLEGSGYMLREVLGAWKSMRCWQMSAPAGASLRLAGCWGACMKIRVKGSSHSFSRKGSTSDGRTSS